MKRLTLFLAIFLFALTLQGQKALTYGGKVLTYDAEANCENYQVVYNAFTEKPSTDINIELNRMVYSIDTYWDSLDVFYLFANHTNDNDEALINWTNPSTFDATNVSATSYTALEGFTGDGAADYLDLGWNPNSDAINYALDDCSLGVYVRNNVGEQSFVFGSEERIPGNWIVFTPRYSDDKTYHKINENITSSAANTDSRGFYVLNRVASNSRVTYKNKNSLNSDNANSVDIPDANIYIFTYSKDDIAQPAYMSTHQVSVFFAGKGLSQTAINTITDAIEGYMDSNSKGIITGTTDSERCLVTEKKVLIVDQVIVNDDNRIGIVEMGQSNMEGRDGDDPLHTIDAGTGYYLNLTTGLFEHLLNDRGGVTCPGSHATYFAETLYTQTGLIPCMTEHGYGGTGLTSTASASHWGAGGLRNAAEEGADSLISLLGVIPIALWCQGERDAQEMDDNGAYTVSIVKAAMQDVIDWWFGEYPESFFLISQTGTLDDGDTQGFVDMRAIQSEIVEENTRVYMAFEGAVNFPGESKMSDNLHYTYEGYNDMGDAFAAELKNILITYGVISEMMWLILLLIPNVRRREFKIAA